MTKSERIMEKQNAVEKLRELLKDGDIVYTHVEHVSSSGMYRHIKPIIIRNNEPLTLPWAVAHALGYPYKEKTHSVGIGGCGMDMGFHLVDVLGRTLGIKLHQRWL
jgi:thiamine pyrophosphate-dependent acetolactate synthase large subunit-like protein